MKDKLLIIILSFLPLLSIDAQRHIMVFDPEVGRPVNDFNVWIDNNRVDSTNIFGEVALPEKFDTLLLTKPGYITLRIPAKLVKDSIPVIKDYNQIGEVVVYASRQNDFQEAVRRWTKENKTEIELRNPITGIKFSMAEIFSAKRRREKKNRKRMAKLFKKMDANDNDPIIHAYRQALNIETKH